MLLTINARSLDEKKYNDSARLQAIFYYVLENEVLYFEEAALKKSYKGLFIEIR